MVNLTTSVRPIFDINKKEKKRKRKNGCLLLFCGEHRNNKIINKKIIHLFIIFIFYQFHQSPIFFNKVERSFMDTV